MLSTTIWIKIVGIVEFPEFPPVLLSFSYIVTRQAGER